MPLKQSSAKKAVSENVRAEKKAHPAMPQAQAVAIALSTQRRAKAKGK